MNKFSNLQAFGWVFLFASTVMAFPVDELVDKRETACIALGNCPGDNPPQAASSSSAPSPLSATTPLASSPSSAPSPTTTQTVGIPSVSIASGLQGPDPTLSVARAAMSPYLYSCSSSPKAVVQQAWSEAGQIADAHAKWVPPGVIYGGSYQPAMDMYIGTDSENDDPWFGTGPLRKNILRQQGIHTTSEDGWSPYWSYAYIYCDESQVPTKTGKPKKPQCNSPNTPGKRVVAYTFSDDGSIFGWNAKYVVLCPRFFEDDILSLSDQVAAAKKKTGLQKVIDPWRKVKARSLFHETYHWGPAEVSDPRCDRYPEFYDASAVVKLASTENVAGSKTNGTSFLGSNYSLSLLTFPRKLNPGHWPQWQYTFNKHSVLVTHPYRRTRPPPISKLC